jgi:hypothetical protein
MVKKILIIFIISLTYSQSAFCDWLQLGNAMDDSFDYFVKPELIKTEGDLRNTWVLFNYRDQNVQVRSRLALNEYDCSKSKVRTNYLISYSGEMGTGEILMSSSPPKDRDRWRVVDHSTVTASIMKAVCDLDSKLPILRS